MSNPDHSMPLDYDLDASTLADRVRLFSNADDLFAARRDGRISQEDLQLALAGANSVLETFLRATSV